MDVIYSRVAEPSDNHVPRSHWASVRPAVLVLDLILMARHVQ